MDNLRLLLLQTRVNPVMIGIERENFLQFLRISSDQLDTLDLYRTPRFDPAIIDQYDGFFMGGLSDDPSNSAVIDEEIFPFLQGLGDLLNRAEEKNIPGLLSCGGFMLGSHLLGAKVILDPEQFEMGVYDIFLTTEGQSDPLMRSLPNPFKMISGHRKSLEALPPGCILLGRSSRCGVHIFKRQKSRIYAFQGHPEITCAQLKSRVEPYKDKYFEDREAFERVINMNEDTSAANGLLQRFIDQVVYPSP